MDGRQGGAEQPARREGPAMRVVHAREALAWMEEVPVWEGASVITSLPDVSEVGMSLSDWRAWFIRAAAKTIDHTPPGGAAIFFQTDIKAAGGWVDKGYLVQRAMEDCGARLLWHKIVCRRAPGTTTFGRPAYAHLLCCSRTLTESPGEATPDVLPELGAMSWSRGMGLQALQFSLRWIAARTRSTCIVDPFCGEGSTLAAANALGFDAVGVELSRRRAARARQLTASLSPEGRLRLHLPERPRRPDAAER